MLISYYSYYYYYYYHFFLHFQLLFEQKQLDEPEQHIQNKHEFIIRIELKQYKSINKCKLECRSCQSTRRRRQQPSDDHLLVPTVDWW